MNNTKAGLIGLGLTLLMAISAPGAAPSAAPEDPVHQELRQLRDGLLAAMNKGSLEAILPFLHTNVVITWHNAEVSRGHQGVRSYYDRVMTGPSKIVESFKCDVKVDELTILYGGSTGISFGSSDEHFHLANGKHLDVKGRWTATLVKDNNRLLVASLHASTNLFDNVLLTIAKKMAIGAGIACLVLGAVAGFLIGRRRKGGAAPA